jgi:hypothetical protein
VLLLLTAFTGFVDWAPLRGMPEWLDEKYTLMSVATLVAFGIVLWRFGFGQWLVTSGHGGGGSPGCLSGDIEKKRGTSLTAI